MRTGLAELVRDLRSRPEGPDLRDLRTLPLDFGSPLMERFLDDQPPYDCVLNFAAIKHVRSEKDLYCTLQMLDTNVLKPARLLRWLAAKGGTRLYFCVSTDKAANPVNLMGASKRVMEHVAFSGEVAALPGRVASARFANVAFSDGGLLYSFQRRLENRQPLAAPRGSRRFFVSIEEAGQICLLAAACAPDRHLLVPRLNPADHLRELDDVAVAFLARHGLSPHFCEDETEARTSVAEDLAKRKYPLLLTRLDTCGEKPYEEFVAGDESAVEVGMRELLAVLYSPAPAGSVLTLLESLENARGGRSVTDKQCLVRALSGVIPTFRHVETGKNLDERM